MAPRSCGPVRCWRGLARLRTGEPGGRAQALEVGRPGRSSGVAGGGLAVESTGNQRLCDWRAVLGLSALSCPVHDLKAGPVGRGQSTLLFTWVWR